ncbi:YggS family pyridoxal phosphate-dependent enzyme [bacterium]|nr:YggS family pyridoxal phosphate-dependent enzyme [bacterium]
MSIQNRLHRVNANISDAIKKSGRDPGKVRLVAISKTHPVDLIRDVFLAGQTVFGESRVQEAKSKIELFTDPVEWHLVGHLQSNKAKSAVCLFHTIHSVDSLKLLAELNRRAIQINKIIRILLQINVSGEDSKSGINPDYLPELADAACGTENLEFAGLMTIPPFSANPEDSRRYFAVLRDLAGKCLVNRGLIPESKLELSMGMSGDYMIAIQEGSTLVRVGTAIFGHR